MILFGDRLYFVVGILLIPICHISSAIKDCKNVCNDKWSSKVLYETCLRQCYQNGSTDNGIVKRQNKTYPQPPRNIQVTLSVRILRYTKYIAAKVNWESDEDEKRDGYYLSFLAKSASCEKKFPGFHTLNIPSNARSFDIPSQTPSFQPLLLDFGCRYQLEMRSKPYPYGDPIYTTLALVDIPNCINGYCSCRSQQKPPDPENVTVVPVEDATDNKTKIQVSWKYVYPNDNFEKETIEFRVKIADLLRKANVAPWKKIFRWTQWEDGLVANKSREKYSVDLPMVMIGNEYKVQVGFLMPSCLIEIPVMVCIFKVFAFNQHLCRSNEIEKEFVASNISALDKSTGSSYLPIDSFTTDRADNETTDIFVENPITPVTGVISTDVYVTYKPTSDNLTTVVPPVVSPSVTVIPSRDEYLVVFLPIIGVLCLIISAFAVWKFYSSHKERLLKKKQYLARMHENPWSLISNGHANSTMETNILYTEKEITDARAHGLVDDFEISYERLTLGRVIGQGAFGLVYMGQADSIRGISGPTQVAIKQLKANADERERKEFLAEIEIMKRIDAHPNIVTMYGCCTLLYPNCTVMEYVPYGDLLKYLRNLRKKFEKEIEEYKSSLERDYIMHFSTHPLMTRVEINTNSDKASNSSRQFLSAYDIMTESTNSNNRNCHCGHCENLGEPIPFVDSDINIASGNGESDYCSLDVAELQSFALQVACGMAHLENLQITHRDLACRNILLGHGKVLKISDFGLSRVGIYVKTTSGRIPLRWLSVEAMRDHAYSTKSDVWAYGVLLWEICTLGGFPYPTVADKEILRYLEAGNRLEQPSSCSDDIYKLMNQCWSTSANQRPSFNTIKRILKEMQNDGHAYVEFSPQEEIDLPPEDYCRIVPVPLATMDEVGFGPIGV